MPITSFYKAACNREERIEYDYSVWKSHYIKDPDRLQSVLDEMNLVGRVIRDIRLISLVYNMRPDDISETIWNETMGYSDEAHDYITDLDNVDDSFPFPLLLELDEPVLFRLDDGDQFEILTDLEGTFSVSVNRLLWNTQSRINDENINGSVLLDLCIGATIQEVEVGVSRDDSGVECIDSVRIGLEKDRYMFNIVFSSYCYDYMHMDIMERWGDKTLHCPFLQVKKSIYKDLVHEYTCEPEKADKLIQSRNDGATAPRSISEVIRDIFGSNEQNKS